MSITGVLPPGRALDAPVMDIVSLNLSPPPQWVRSGAAAGDRDGRRDKLERHVLFSASDGQVIMS
jgi:hypothetical protein